MLQRVVIMPGAIADAVSFRCHPPLCAAAHRSAQLRTERVTQYSRDFSDSTETPWTCAGTTKSHATKQKCEAAIAVEALDPGVPYESRWAPYDRIHGPGQGQFPKGSIRPRGYMASDERRSFAGLM